MWWRSYEVRNANRRPADEAEPTLRQKSALHDTDSRTSDADMRHAQLRPLRTAGGIDERRAMPTTVDISDLPSAQMGEATFQVAVIQLAQMYGWSYYHTHDSRRSVKGFPDLLLAHPEHGQIFAELKTDTGRLTPAQIAWAELLQAAEGKPFGARYRLWRPRDLDAIASELAGNFITEGQEWLPNRRRG